MRKLTKQRNLKPNRFCSFVLKRECAISSQTTSVTRVGGPGGLLKVRVEIDKIGDLKLKISDLFGGRKLIGNFFWKYSWGVFPTKLQKKNPHLFQLNRFKKSSVNWTTFSLFLLEKLWKFLMEKKSSELKFAFFLTENTADFFINNMWRPGFPFVRPLINDLVSTAFTDIFNESFRYFPIDDYIKEWYSKFRIWFFVCEDFV